MSRQGLAGLLDALRTNPELKARLSGESNPSAFERLASEAGFAVSATEFLSGTSGELTDAELEQVAGGYTFPQTDWIYCDNPWTNQYCTLKC